MTNDEWKFHRMEFDKCTLEKLKRTLIDLDFESVHYDRGTEEYEFLAYLCREIEDVLRSGGIVK